MNLTTIFSLREIFQRMTVGEIVGTCSVISYIALLGGVYYFRSRRVAQAARQTVQDRPADQREPELPVPLPSPQLNKTPMEAGVGANADVMPTCIADLNAYYDKDHAFRLAGWVSPLGRYYRLDNPCWHDELANRITTSERGSRILVDLGWVHLSQWGSPDMIGSIKQMTQKQVETLTDIAMLTHDTFFGKAIMAGIEASGQ